MSSFTYIDTSQALTQAGEQWKKADEIAVDLECENNLHHYGTYLSIIQLSTKTHNWIVDIIKLKEVPEIVSMLENKHILKIFHDVGFDLRILCHQLHCRPKNILDTQLAAMFLGKRELGLGALLQEYFNVHKEHKFQMADWTKRPLPTELLQYAAGDTIYLLKLRDVLKAELEKKNHWKWVEEECAHLEEKNWCYREGTFDSVKGYRDLTSKQRGILKELFHAREHLAKKVDRPVHFIISTKRLMEYAQHPPQDWSRITAVHPIVKSQGFLFSEALKKGEKEEINIPLSDRKRFSPKQKDIIDKLSAFREEKALELQLPKKVIISQDQMKEVALAGNLSPLRKWQREMMEGKIKF